MNSLVFIKGIVFLLVLIGVSVQAAASWSKDNSILNLSLNILATRASYKICFKNLIDACNRKLYATSSCSNFVLQTDSIFNNENQMNFNPKFI